MIAFESDLDGERSERMRSKLGAVNLGIDRLGHLNTSCGAIRLGATCVCTGLKDLESSGFDIFD